LLLEDLEGAGVLDRDEGQAPAEPERFLEAGDRWEGWWKDEVPSWELFGRAVPVPAEARSVVVDAVRALPMVQRVLVVLRDTTGLAPDECEPLIGYSKEEQDTLLDWAHSNVRIALERVLDDIEAEQGEGGAAP